MKSIVFFISSGRSGSTSLSNFLRVNNENIRVFHGEDRENRVEKENCLHYHRKLKNPSEIIRNKKFKIVNKTIKNYDYVDTSWFLVTFVKELVEVFPNCKIVHLVRDGRDFARSGMSRMWFVNEKKFESQSWIWSRDKWRPPDKYKKRMAKILWLWDTQQKIIINDMKHIPEKNNFGVLKLEDLLNKDYSILNKLGYSTKGDFPKDNVSSKYSTSHWKDWDEELKKECNSIIKNTMTELGYVI